MVPKLLGGKVATHQAKGGRTDHDRIGCRQTLQAGRQIRRLPQRQLFLATAAPILTDHHQAGMDAHPHRQAHPLLLLQVAIERRQGLHHAEPAAHCPLRIVFMRLRIAKVHQQPVAEILRDMAFVALDDGRRRLLVSAHHHAEVFRVELPGEARGVGQVTEQHRELAAFGLRDLRSGWRSGWGNRWGCRTVLPSSAGHGP